MSGFAFGKSASTAAPVTGGLFGSSSKPLFGAPATTAQTSLFAPATISTSIVGRFGTPASTTASTASSTGLFGSTAPSGGLFGTPAKTTTTGSLFGTPTVTTISTSSGLFGSTAVATTSLFGTTSASTSTASLFGKPATGLFGTPATTSSTTGGLFGTSTTATSTTSVGLGGTGALMTTGLTSGSSLGVAGAAASGNPVEGEVPQMVMELLNMLREQIKRNQELSDEFALNSSDTCLQMSDKIEELMGMRVKYAESVRKAKAKANDLLGKMQRDVRVAEQMRRRQKEMSKNPQFGRKQAFEYLLGICAEHENTAREFWETLTLLEDKIAAKLDKKDMITKKDLQTHFEHYDQTFKVICADLYRCKMQVQDAKDTFLDYRKRVMPYAPNPFEGRKLARAERWSPSETRFTGAEAFPSQVTMMKIGEMAKSSATNHPSAGTTGFGTTGSLFGAKPFGSTAFSFNPSGSTTTGSLFKPFSVTSTASAPLFGSITTSVAGAPPPAPTTASSFTFGNTLNSSVSGTLFGGSASKPWGR